MQAISTHSSSSELISALSVLLNSEFLRWFAAQVLQLWHTSRFDGIYNVNAHHVTLELLDRQGKTAVYTKRQDIEFRQNGVFAIQDQAWGDGDLFAQYTCSPGVAVDRYKEGYRWKILISLRGTRNKGDQERLVVERTVKDGFTTPVGNFQTQVDHPTQTLSISVIFPRTRHPKYVTVIEQNMKRTYTLGQASITPLSKERVQYQWQVNKPRLYEAYILRWEW
jgi:hypothetical protein